MPGNMIGPDTVRVNTQRAWRVDVLDSENGLFYYFIQTKQGEEVHKMFVFQIFVQNNYKRSLSLHRLTWLHARDVSSS